MSSHNYENDYEIRDSEEAQTILFQSLWLQRAMPPTESTVREALDWGMELLSQGESLPPLCFVADVGHVALARDWEAKTNEKMPDLHKVSPNLLATYEDHVLGKIYADWSFSHAGDALRKYKPGRDQAKGIAFILTQFRERARYAGMDMSPSILATAREMPPEDVLREGYESIQSEGLHELLEELLESLINRSRTVAEILGPEDVLELQMGTALDPAGERLALRQTLLAANLLEATLPAHRIRPMARREEVPTRVLDEDSYPVGGFTSLSNKGSVESLLHSQLAYIEDEDERPDLFDIKFLRNELLYYSRDENQFLRRRRTFVIAFCKGLLDQIRFKDAELPYQRGILMLSLIYVTVSKLIEWLSTDALHFDFVFLNPDENVDELAAERELLERLFREQIANGTVSFYRMKDSYSLEQHCSMRARRSLCHCLAVSPKDEDLHAQDTVVTRFRIRSARPEMAGRVEDLEPKEADDDFGAWSATLQDLLSRWV